MHADSHHVALPERSRSLNELQTDWFIVPILPGPPVVRGNIRFEPAKDGVEGSCWTSYDLGLVETYAKVFRLHQFAR